MLVSVLNHRKGWNGGGSANSPGAGGGGSTDIALYGKERSEEWNTRDHLYSRIIVAGAGGGAAHHSYPNWYGGCGGGLCGQDNKTKRKGGSQTIIYIDSSSCSTDQGFGVGGSNNVRHSSGGGSGWFGGCASNNANGWGAGGAGGSGYVYNSETAINYPEGCLLDDSFYLSDSITIRGDTEIPNINKAGIEKGHLGNGFAAITPQL